MSDPVDDEQPTPIGRPTGYREEFIADAKALAERGLIDVEIAEAFGITDRTLRRWKIAYPDFAAALKEGKDEPDDRVQRSLYQRANGYNVTEQQAIKIKVGPHEEKVQIVNVTRHVPADTTANVFWMKNRRGWRDKVDHEHSGKDGKPIETNLNLTGLNDDQLRALASIPLSGE